MNKVHKKKNEIRVCGRSVCELLFKHYPKRIIRVWHNEARGVEFAKELDDLKRFKKGRKLVGEEELQKVTASTHHEGIAMLIQKPRMWKLADFLEKNSAAKVNFLLLENIGNPHNLGAIARVAAHYGVDAILVIGEQAAKPSPAAYRISEGGLLAVPVIDLQDVNELKILKKGGFQFYATSSHTKQSIYSVDFSDKVVFCFGAEGDGLSRKLLAKADQKVILPGTGLVESLNVATATAALLAEHWRRSQI